MPSHPLNLAVFRITVFLMLRDAVSVRQISAYASYPREMMIIPYGMGWLFGETSLSPELATAGATALSWACLIAAAGLLTRLSAGVAAALATVVLAIPELYGKVNHSTMFLIWFAALLACSPSGDALSIDALLRRWRGYSSGRVWNPGAQQIYGLPLRMAMVLLGLLYFFPGFWKLAIGGKAWLSGEILAAHMVRKWYLLDFVPAFRIDHYPMLLAIAGTGTVAFELLFLPLVLTRYRGWIALVGFSFHFGTRFFMRISFAALQATYVIFVDWYRLGRWVAQRTVGTGHPLKIDMHRPFAAARAALVQTLDVWDIFTVRPVGTEVATRPEPDSRRLIWLATVGATLLIACGLIHTGQRKIGAAWPFACFPDFAGKPPSVSTNLEIETRGTDGVKTVNFLMDPALRKVIASERLQGMAYGLTRAPKGRLRHERAEALLRVIMEAHPELKGSASVKVFKTLSSVLPEDKGKPPFERVLLWERPSRPRAPLSGVSKTKVAL